MKTWLTRHRQWLLALGIVAAALAVFALGWYAGANASNRKAYAALWEAIVDLPDPEQCALCAEERRYQAPCLIDLSTGEMGEMQVYTYGPTKQGKLDPREAQFSGTFSLRSCAGLTAFQDTDFHTCEVTLPAEQELINPALYCKECRMLLAGAGIEGYVILDLYDLDSVQAYPIGYEIIRDYRISVTGKKDGSKGLCVAGLLEY